MNDIDAEKAEYKEYSLKRSGKLPLRIKGKRIGYSRSPETNGRWSACEIYQTARGKYVIAYAYITLWQGETSGYDAMVFDDIDAFKRYLQEEILDGNVPNYILDALAMAGISEEEVE